MRLPDFVTHYHEADYGPFLNVCDLGEEQVGRLVMAEKDARTAFNRFAIGPDFFRWRRAADDLLVRAYAEKFGFAPQGRPYFAVLGSFDRTLTMFRNGRKIALEVAGFADHELTFMYPDHAHLLAWYGSDAPRLFHQMPLEEMKEKFWGLLLTFAELSAQYAELDIAPAMAAHQARDGWAGCYIEAHLWRRDLRREWDEGSGS